MNKTNAPSMQKFSIEYQYQEFLKLVGLPESRMPPDQRREMRRAFYGCAGRLLILFRNDLSELPEPVGVATLEKMLQETVKFWENENRKQNG